MAAQRKISLPFDQVWRFESQVREAYPSHYTIRYGSPHKSKSGADLIDWMVLDGEREVARHTGMVLTSKQTGNPYLVVSIEKKPPPASAELKALMNEIAAQHGR